MSLPQWVNAGTVVDATRAATLNIRERDIATAVPNKGDECVAARCALRALDAVHVYFYRGTAYVQLDNDGPVERFVVSAAMRRDVIVPLDAGHPDRIKSGRYDLVPPTGSARLGQAVKRRTALRIRREQGDAPPPTRREYRARPMVGRIRSAGRS